MRFFLTFSLVVSFLTINSQVTTTVNPTIAQLVQKLSGNGITINNFSLTCSPGAYALYSGGTGQLATLSSGILLTTGSASNVAGPNNVTSGTNNSYPGSVLGDTLNGQGPNMTHDACYLTFLLTPACNTLSINYVFASNEYSDYVSSPPTPAPALAVNVAVCPKQMGEDGVCITGNEGKGVKVITVVLIVGSPGHELTSE